MSPAIPPTQLYDACHGRLQLGWLSPQTASTRTIQPPPGMHHASAIIGHFNPVTPLPVPVLGQAALAYLGKLKKNSLHDALEALCAPPTAVILIAEGLNPPDGLAGLVERHGIALLHSPARSEQLIEVIGQFLAARLSESLVLHGVFMEVMGIGVLLGGDSGIGKSELALELINRGQRLIADDAPIFQRSRDGSLLGRCPTMLQDYLEVRGLGLLNIRAMFGDSAVKQQMPLQLIVRLVSTRPEHNEPIDRLHGSRQPRDYLGVTICEVSLPVAPGRNLAVLVEAAARSHILYTNGIDPAHEFIQRQQHIMRSEST